MLAKTQRINVTFEKATIKLLTQFAMKEHQALASLVRKLTLEALEMHEDFYLSQVALKLDHAGVKTYSHSEAWK